MRNNSTVCVSRVTTFFLLLCVQTLFGCDKDKIYSAKTVSADIPEIGSIESRSVPLSFAPVDGLPKVARLSGTMWLPSQFNCSQGNSSEAIGDHLPCEKLAPDEHDHERFLKEYEIFVGEFRGFLSSGDYEVLQLDSVGGTKVLGLHLAVIVNDSGVETHVPEGAVCLSACVPVLLAGRQIRADGIVGVHRPQVRIDNPLPSDLHEIDAVLDFELLVRRLVGGHEELYQLQNETPAAKLAILTREQKVRFGLLQPAFFDGWIFRAPPRTYLPYGPPVGGESSG